MSKVLVTESYLSQIANAIRSKLGGSTEYRPGDMANAIESIPTGGITPTGTKNITQNGTHDVTQYASANVNVQPNLQSKTATENGTVTPDQGYDGLSSVVVNVSGGGGYFNRLTPIHSDLVGGYISGNIWYVGDTSSRTDVYQVEAGKAYLAVSGSNHGNRFRCSFFSTDPAQATENLNGYALYTDSDSPINYNIAANLSSGVLSLYIPSANGYIGIGKTNQFIDGLDSYLFEVNI